MNGILHWPEHHAGIAWWIAIIISSPVWIRWAWRGLRTLPIYGAKFAYEQRAVRIRNLEYFNGQTYRLVLYLAGEALELAKEFTITLLGLASMAWVTHRTLTVSAVVIFTALTLGSFLFGNVYRLRLMVHDLRNYDTALAELKRKQETSIKPIKSFRVI